MLLYVHEQLAMSLHLLCSTSVVTTMCKQQLYIYVSSSKPLCRYNNVHLFFKIIKNTFFVVQILLCKYFAAISLASSVQEEATEMAAKYSTTKNVFFIILRSKRALL